MIRVPLTVDTLHVEYGAVRALRGVSLEAKAGEIVGILGPNGAGKTTLVETVEGLRRPTWGSCRVFGLDPWTRRREVHRRLGVQLQATALQDDERVEQVIDVFRGIYPDPASTREALDRVGLSECRRKRMRSLSGGQRQRVGLALALLGRPSMIVVDEPTTGLDPVARRRFWGLLQDFRATGGTILVTTHLMDEAEALCDRVVLIDRGAVAASGTPASVRDSILVGTVRFGLADAVSEDEVAAGIAGHLAAAGDLRSCEREPDGRYLLKGRDADALLLALGAWAAEHGRRPERIESNKQTLEAAYLELMSDTPGAEAH